MSRATQTWIIVGALFVSVAALIYFFRPQDAQPDSQALAAKTATAPEAAAELAEPLPAAPDTRPAEPEKLAGVGNRLMETFEDVTFVFQPTANSRKLVAFRTSPTSKDEDGTCTAPYVARERVSKITYAHGFVIDKFNTWNEKEGQQEYLPFESDLPRIYQGGLHDIVQEGRTVTVTKQRCGMGQVEALVAVEV